MQKENYLISVTILEARDLVSSTENATNPFVRIRVGSESQITTTQERMNTVTWNQSFTFNHVSMDPYEFENAELILEVWDVTGLSLARGDQEAGLIGKIFGEKLVGHYSIGLSTLFRSPNHELYKQWLRLQAKNEPTICTGFLLVSCFVIGQHQLPPSHKEGEDEENQTMSRQAILEQQRQNQGLQVISAPVFEKRTFQLILKIFKGDGLPNNNGAGEKYWVKVRTQGCDEETNRVDRLDRGSLDWNTMFKFPVYWPTYNDKIVLKMMRSTPQGFFLLSNSEYFLANIPEKPSRLDIFNISELMSREGKMDPQWVNIYGVRAEDLKNDGSDQPASAWLGRILLSLYLVDLQGSRPALKKDSTPLPPEPKTQLYTIQADVFELYCPEFLKSIQFTQKDKMTVTIMHGTKEMTSRKGIQSNENGKLRGVIEWKNKRSLLSDQQGNYVMEIDLPESKQQRAHLFVYLNHGPKRVGFIRIETQEIIENKDQIKPKWRNVMSMEKQNQVIGQLLIHIMFTPQKERNQLNSRIYISQSQQANYSFLCQIVSGYEIAPHLQQLETKVKVEIGKKPLETPLKGGHFPLYDFTDHLLQVSLSKDLEFAPSMALLLIDRSGTELGKALIAIPSIFKPKKPSGEVPRCELQYFTFFDQAGTIVGKVLARFKLVDGQKYLQDEVTKLKREFEMELRANIYQTSVQVCLVGVRGLTEKVKQAKIEVGLTESILDDENETQIRVQPEQKNPWFGQIQADPWEIALSMRSIVRHKIDNSEANLSRKFDAIISEMQEYVKSNKEQIRELQLKFMLEIKLDSLKGEQRNLTFTFDLCKGEVIKKETEAKDKKKLEAYLVLTKERFVKFFDSPREVAEIRDKEKGGERIESVEKMLQILFNYKPKVRIESYQVGQKKEKLLQLVGQEQIQDGRENKKLYETEANGTSRWGTFEMMKANEDDDLPITDTKNPNFGVIVTFKNVSLNKHLLCWPLLCIKLYDDTNNLLMQMTQPLFLYITQQNDLGKTSRFPRKSTIKVALAQLIYSPTEQLTQQQENPRRTYLRRIQDQKSSQHKISKDIELELATIKHEIKRKEIDEIPSEGEEGLQNLFDDGQQRTTYIRGEQETKVSTNDNGQQEDTDEPEEHKYLTIEDLKRQIGWGDSNTNALKEKERAKEQADSSENTQVETEDYIITEVWHKSNEIQQAEQEHRAQKLRENNEIFEKLGRIKRYFDRNKSNSTLAEEIINALKKVRQRNENLENEIQVQDELQRLLEERSDIKEQKVKRDIILEEEVNEILPFKKQYFMSVPLAQNYQLFGGVQTFESKPVHGQIYRAGKRLNAFLRMTVKINPAEEFKNEEHARIEPIDLNSDQEMVLKEMMKRSNVDIFNPEFLKQVMTGFKDLRLILTVLRCQNLTAVDNYSRGWINQFKQEISRCSADPYITVEVGENDNKKSNIEEHKTNTLNPEFNKDFNFTVNMPDDWRLVVRVFDKQTNRIKLLQNDALIGETQIDLEERQFSNRLYLCKLINDIQLSDRKKHEKEISKLMDQTISHQFRHYTSYQQNTRKHDYQRQINILTEEKRWLQQCPIKPPTIEIRSLFNEKHQAQGTVQLMTEVLTENEMEKRYINEKLNVSEEEEYEIRLIIYKVVGVFEADGSNVSSMWVRAVMEANNWNEMPDSKNTESQSNVVAGKAIFNYRLIFGLKIPAEFPRIKLQVYSGKLINAHQALGETTIDLKKTIELLKKQGLEEKKVFVKFVGQNNRKVGHALIQLQILTKSDAAVNPVGEGWGEPNRDPYLARPSQGSFAQRFGLPSLPSISLGLPSFQKYLIIIGVAIILVIVAGFLLMFFKK